jgi:uncharacterized RDD family membrane protein YckC
MSDFDPPIIVETPRADALASIGKRALAQFLDGLVVGIPLFAITAALGYRLTDSSLSNSALTWLTVLWVGANLMYNIIGVAVYGYTVGKRIVGIKVVSRADGGRVTWTYASLRALIPTAVQLVPVVGPGLSLVVYLRAVFHPLRQGLHDVAAGTIVVKR